MIVAADRARVQLAAVHIADIGQLVCGALHAAVAVPRPGMTIIGLTEIRASARRRVSAKMAPLV